MNYECKCGSMDFFTVPKGNNIGLYCSMCGKWKKWLGKDEAFLFEHNKTVNKTEKRNNNTIKISRDILVDFINFSDEKQVLNNDIFDEIFKALLGSDTDGYGEKYSHCYKWELLDFSEDLINTINKLEKFYHINEDILSAYIISNMEDICGLFRDDKLDYDRLNELCKLILDEFCNKNK